MVFVIGLSKEKNYIRGVRLLDIRLHRICDRLGIELSELLQFTATHTRIENLKLVDGQARFINGAMERYPIIVGQGLGDVEGKSPAIILGKNVDNKFICTDYKGNIKIFTESELVDYGAEQGIANGKIVKGHISAIEGSYTMLQGNKTNTKFKPIKDNNGKNMIAK